MFSILSGILGPFAGIGGLLLVIAIGYGISKVNEG